MGESPEVTATAGGCCDCWKLRRVAGDARNMTENALFILIVFFSAQLQQTETSDRKLSIFRSIDTNNELSQDALLLCQC